MKPLKIWFIDPMEINYDPNTPYEAPLGGTQASVAYLSAELVKLGHEVWLFNHTLREHQSRGVQCIPFGPLDLKGLKSLQRYESPDCILVVCGSAYGPFLKGYLPNVPIFLYMHHNTDQQAARPLRKPENCAAWDRYLFVAHWQSRAFQKEFGIAPERCLVLHNAMAPSFAAACANIDFLKEKKPILVYTSTPFRGLKYLIGLFPPIKRLFPKARLRIFSSLKVYQQDEADHAYDDLYTTFSQMDGVEYVGSVGQSDLALALREASVLSYPNTFLEMCPITIMESMAAGLAIVSTDAGGIPEVAQGYGSLLSIKPPAVYAQNFCHHVLEALRAFDQKDLTFIARLEEQLRFAHDNYRWEIRATEFVDMLENYLAEASHKPNRDHIRRTIAHPVPRSTPITSPPPR